MERVAGSHPTGPTLHFEGRSLSTPELIQLLAALDFDPMALAAQLDHAIIDILEWYESPEVQDLITRYEAFEDRMLELRAKRSKRTAIETLETVINTAEDLPERRRAATTLLRALTRPLQRSKARKREDDESLLDDSIRSASRAVPRGTNSGDTNSGDTNSGGTASGGTDLQDVNTLCHQRSPVDASVQERSSTPPSEPGNASDHGDDTRDVDAIESITNPHHDDRAARSDIDQGAPDVRNGPAEVEHPNSRTPIVVRASRPAQTGARNTNTADPTTATHTSNDPDTPEPHLRL